MRCVLGDSVLFSGVLVMSAFNVVFPSEVSVTG